MKLHYYRFSPGVFFLSSVLALPLVWLSGCASMDRPANVSSAATPATAGTLTPTQITQIVASPDRSEADRTNDLRRRPEQMLAFIGVRPGMLALAVGLSGRVYGQSEPSRGAGSPVRATVAPEGNAAPSVAPAATSAPAMPMVRRTSAQALTERAKNPTVANIVAVVQPFEEPVPAQLVGKLDLATLMFNYHDFGHMGVDRARMNRAVFAGLKSGGIYVIADHSGRPGTGISEAGTLHRIEEAFLRQEVEAAGFKLAAQGNFMRNPSDPRDQNTPNPPQPKDEFVLKFVKP
jgi:predicted methyltransferase